MCPGPEAGTRLLPVSKSGTFQIISWQPGVRWPSRQWGWEAHLLSDQELLLTRQVGREAPWALWPAMQGQAGSEPWGR